MPRAEVGGLTASCFGSLFAHESHACEVFASQSTVADFLFVQHAGFEFLLTRPFDGRKLAARAIRKGGGVTWFAAAHANFSSSVWQQHLSQQWAALTQPHGHFSQGNRSVDDFETGIGTPVTPRKIETNRHATTQSVRRLRFFGFKLY